MPAEQKRTMSRRDFLRLAAVGGAASVLAACAPPSTSTPAPTSAAGAGATVASPTSGSAQPVTISMWFHDFLYVKFFKNRAPEFEQMHPEYKFTWDIVQVPDAQIADKFISALVAGTGAPDIGGVQNQVLPRFFKGQLAEKGLVDLAPKVGAEKGNFVCWEPYTLNGHIYGIEISSSPTYYFYRSDLFQKAGIDPTTMETWDDFVSVGKQMKAKGYAMAMYDTTYPEPNLLDLQLKTGGGYYDKDGNVIIDNDANVEALTKFLGLINTDQVIQGTTDFWGPGGTAAIKDNKIAGMIMPDWYLDYVLKNTFPEQSGKWSAMPAFALQKGGIRGTYTGGTGMSIFQQSKSPDLAWELLHYSMMTPEAQAKKWSEIHYAPTMTQAWTDKRLTDDPDPYLGGYKLGQIWADELPKLPALFTGQHRAEMISGLSSDVLTQVVSGQKTPKDALKALGDSIRAMGNS